LDFPLLSVKKLFEMARGKPCSHEEMEQMKKKAAQTKSDVEATANSSKKICLL